MDSSSDSASFAHISLTAAGSSDSGLSIPERRVTLSPANSSVVIGRASKTSSKGFLAAGDNAWFDSAVMSRKHAEIKADLKAMKVKIQDLGSLHGTYINDEKEKIPSHELRELQDGDSVRFGVGVWRATENFVPATVKVGIAFDHRTQRASSTFKVPEDSDNESDIECYSNNGDCEANDSAPIIIMEGKRVSETIDLTGQRPITLNNARLSPMEPHKADVIDLSSPPQSPVGLEAYEDESDSDSVFEVRVVPSSITKASTIPDTLGFASEIVQPEIAEPEMAEDDFNDEDVDQASYYDDEISDPYLEDDRASIDYGDEEESDVDSTDSDADTGSIASEEGAPYGLDYQQASHFNSSEHESDGFDESDGEGEPHRYIGEIDDDTSDQDEPRDPFWKPRPIDSFTFTPETPMKHITTLPTIPPTIVSLLNNDETETRPTLAHSFGNQVSQMKAPRPPSPSDFIMSKSFPKSTDVSELFAGAELLASKSGKRDYFEAREENKISMQKTATAFSSVHSLCNNDHPAGEYHDIAETITARGASATEEQNFALPHISSHFGSLDMLASEATAASTSTQVMEEPKTTAVPATATDDSSVSRRTRLGISDIVDDCQRVSGQPISDKVSDKGKEKRKAKDISTLSEEDEEWAARDKPTQAKITVPIPPTPSPVSGPIPAREVSPVSMDTDTTEIELPAPPKMDAPPVTVGSDPRAPKRRRLRKIAERVGYAALGGVTAGAMIVGTLIYTAPTF